MPITTYQVLIYQGSRYYTYDDIRIRTYKRGMFCDTCFASHNTWLTGPPVGLARSVRTNTCVVKGKVARAVALYCCIQVVLCTWHGDRYEFRDGAPTADGVLYCWVSSP